jgi:hypothetical protein
MHVRDEADEQTFSHREANVIALLAWTLTVTLTSDDIRHGAIFPNEKACVHAGEKWMDDAIEFARRMHNPPPKGWICMPTEREPSKVSP